MMAFLVSSALLPRITRQDNHWSGYGLLAVVSNVKESVFRSN